MVIQECEVTGRDEVVWPKRGWFEGRENRLWLSGSAWGWRTAEKGQLVRISQRSPATR
jgi:hypothetical protein